MLVKGEGPLDAKIFIIGEAPGQTEELKGKPFCGGSGWELDKILKAADIRREDCYVDNIMQERPPSNDFSTFYKDKAKTQPSEGLLQGHQRVRDLIRLHHPNVVCALGNEALYAICDKRAITKWRGSILGCSGVKVIPSIHPAMVMRQYEYFPISCFDMRRVKEESLTPQWPLPYNDKFIINPSFEKIMEVLKCLRNEKYVCFDIETDMQNHQIKCLGFGWSREDAICIPIFFAGNSWWTLEQELAIISEIRELFLSSSVNFIAQNAQFDMIYLQDKWGVQVPNLWMDTMIAFHCVYPELPKGLDFLSSIYTHRPYHKDDAYNNPGPDGLWHYNCLMKNTRVVLGDGTTESIDTLVKKQYTGTVMSYNEETKTIEPKNVIGWTQNKYDDFWWRIKTKYMEKDERGIVATPNHQILTQRGWVPISLLKRGDRIATQEYELTNQQLQVMLGTVLGDGHLSCRNGLKAGLVVSQKCKRLVEEKQKYLGGNIRQFTHTGFGVTTEMYELSLPYTSYQGDIQRVFYKDNKKVVIKDVLNMLKPLGLAHWYMDDGCLANNTECRIAVNCFTPEEQEMVRAYFEAWYGPTSLSQGSIRLLAKASYKFCDQIKEFVPFEMSYKLMCNCSYKEPIIDKQSNQLYYEDITVKEQYLYEGVGRGYNNTNYCLTVEGNHNFFTVHGLVANCLDTVVTWEAAMAIHEELKEFGTLKFYEENSHKLIAPLIKMQRRGVRIDAPYRLKLDTELEAKAIELQAKVDAAVGHPLNVASPLQMKNFLYKELGLPEQTKRKTGNITADEDAILKLSKQFPNPLFDIILEIRHIRKVLSTYIRAELDQDGRLRTSYVITGTTSGRLASRGSVYGTGTNLQNIDRDLSIRRMFIADEGKKFINADLSQAEARVVAYLSREDRLKAVFAEGGDIHRRNASIIFHKPVDIISENERQLAKTLVHAANYGIGVRKFATTISSTEDRARQLLNLYHANYPRIRMWHMEVEEQLRKSRVLETPLGRKRMFFGRWGNDLTREAIAYVPQSTVGDVLNMGIIRCKDAMPQNWEMILQNHDAVLMQVPLDADPQHVSRFLKHYFEFPIEVNGEMLTIPIDIKEGLTWGDLHKLEIPHAQVM